VHPPPFWHGEVIHESPKLHVGPVKPARHKHSAIVGAICRQIPPFWQVFAEQTDPIQNSSIDFLLQPIDLSYSIHIVVQQILLNIHIEHDCYSFHIVLHLNKHSMHMIHPNLINSETVFPSRISNAYISNNRNVRNLADTSTWNYSVLQAVHMFLDWDKVFSDKHSYIDIDRPSNILDKRICISSDWLFQSVDKSKDNDKKNSHTNNSIIFLFRNIDLCNHQNIDNVA